MKGEWGRIRSRNIELGMNIIAVFHVAQAVCKSYRYANSTVCDIMPHTADRFRKGAHPSGLPIPYSTRSVGRRTLIGSSRPTSPETAAERAARAVSSRTLYRATARGRNRLTGKRLVPRINATQRASAVRAAERPLKQPAYGRSALEVSAARRPAAPARGSRSAGGRPRPDRRRLITVWPGRPCCTTENRSWKMPAVLAGHELGGDAARTARRAARHQIRGVISHGIQQRRQPGSGGG